jgi:glycosyltransferase involved in cell wall biosynthesis
VRILRIIYDWPPPWSGLAAHPYELTVSQAKLGHSFDIFCGRWPKAGAIETPSSTKVHTFLREILPGTLTVTVSIVMFLYYLIWRRKNKVDIIHSHGHFGIWIYFYRYLLQRFFPKAKELQTPLVVHFHNVAEGRESTLKEKGSQIKPFTEKFVWPMEKRANIWAVKSAAAYVFVSEDTKQEAIKYYEADPKKCFVVETGVNTELFVGVGPEEKEKTRIELGLDPNDIVILNHGTMVERKNIHLLVEALKFLPPRHKLLLVGPSDPVYNQKLNELVSLHKLEDRVVRVGYTPYPQVPIAFQAADLFVLPSQWEGLPKVVMQSLSCGVPVLASGFSVKEEISGLLYIKGDLSARSIADNVLRVLQNPPQVDVGKIRTHYSWDVKARELDHVYDFVKQRE